MTHDGQKKSVEVDLLDCLEPPQVSAIDKRAQNERVPFFVALAKMAGERADQMISEWSSEEPESASVADEKKEEASIEVERLVESVDQFTNRIESNLRREGIEQLGQILAYTREELEDINGIGKRSVDKLEKKLKSIGFDDPLGRGYEDLDYKPPSMQQEGDADESGEDPGDSEEDEQKEESSKEDSEEDNEKLSARQIAEKLDEVREKLDSDVDVSEYIDDSDVRQKSVGELVEEIESEQEPEETPEDILDEEVGDKTLIEQMYDYAEDGELKTAFREYVANTPEDPHLNRVLEEIGRSKDWKEKKKEDKEASWKRSAILRLMYTNADFDPKDEASYPESIEVLADYLPIQPHQKEEISNLADKLGESNEDIDDRAHALFGDPLDNLFSHEADALIESMEDDLETEEESLDEDELFEGEVDLDF